MFDTHSEVGENVRQTTGKPIEVEIKSSTGRRLGLNYIQGYQSEGTVTHNIFIDPSDIGAIIGTGYGNDGAMRVRRYFVHSSFAGVNKNIYHSSKFAAMTDGEYVKSLEEVVNKFQTAKADIDSKIDEANAIATI